MWASETSSDVNRRRWKLASTLYTCFLTCISVIPSYTAFVSLVTCCLGKYLVWLLSSNKVNSHLIAALPQFFPQLNTGVRYIQGVARQQSLAKQARIRSLHPASAWAGTRAQVCIDNIYSTESSKSGVCSMTYIVNSCAFLLAPWRLARVTPFACWRQSVYLMVG